MSSVVPGNGETEAQISPDSARKQGGWTTFPFIAGTLMGSSIALSGWANNLIVYMIEKFHVRSIDATQTFNIAAASTSLLPVIAAILADSILGCYTVIWMSSLVAILGIILLSLTAMLEPLRPAPCQNGSSMCPIPSKVQFSVLYSGIALASIGVAGTRFTIAAMGANQFEESKDQRIFFNWFAVTLYTSMVLGATVIVYIEENVSWTLGYCLCFAVNVIGLAILLLGRRYYRHVKPQGSPFTRLAHVITATILKRKIPLSSRAEDYYYQKDGAAEKGASMPTKSFRFLNHAALETEGDTKADGSIAKPWRLCSVQQVEDLKCLLRIFPLLSSSIVLCTTLPVVSTLTILQALTVDRHLGPNLKVPAGSMIVFILTSTAINLTFIDRLLFPMWQKITHKSPMPLQRIGLGHLFNMTGMSVAALVESRRLKLAQIHHLSDHPGSTVPMLVLWLVPQLVLVGLGEAFHYPGQVTLYYQEFPKPLRSTATAMISVVVAISYYLSTAVIDLVRRVTPWLPDNINKGKLGNVYLMFAMMQMFNFFYFLFISKCYKYQRLEEGNKSNNESCNTEK
ncbi:Proton-dependent oligopeptide transporter family [Corchorus olitorius]|uniref:Proton-dependent oligopeptide transporter family n=1 Tax=Corchorus olitorius TaxID=93759 RepID=A0A1R3I3P1_9ROSI|nr:Proton-dependent oligopeptide transporter family [Corchorus olitorius]